MTEATRMAIPRRPELLRPRTIEGLLPSVVIDRSIFPGGSMDP